jgi:hypothetical protein
MAVRRLVFRAALIGNESPADHIARILNDPLYRVQSVGEDADVRFEIVGPLAHPSTGTFEEVLENCRERARQLGLQDRGVAESVASKIVCGDMAERQVLASPLTIVMSAKGRMSRADIELSVDDQGPADARACMPDYARWRVGCVARALGMQIDTAEISN